jgi:uncharacterized membrane protein
VCARLAEDGRHRIRVALDVTGLAAVAGCAALARDGATLTAAWALEAVALAGIARRRDDAVARIAALVHLGAAATWALYDQAAPAHLLDGDVALGPAALGLAAVAGGALLVARTAADDRTRDTLRIGAALAVLHLASLAAVAITPGADADDALGLGARQQGQLQLSALWALTGAGALVAGLRRDVRELRVAALLLLAVVTAKVFVFDLSALEAGYRVGSFIAVGVVLLAGSFAYARLRPEPLADLREVPPALR